MAMQNNESEKSAASVKIPAGRKKRIARVALTLAALLLLAGIFIYRNVQQAGVACRTAAEVAPAPVAVVFGCGYSAAGPSPVMYDRVATAAELYRAGKVRKLLMTGDNSRNNYNEPDMMRRVARKLGVPDNAIVCDYAGFCTYDSVYRARDVFGVRRAIFVSQAYHLPRALFIARQLGLDAQGAQAQARRAPADYGKWRLREIVSCEVAWVEAKFLRPRPRFLGRPEPIPF